MIQVRKRDYIKNTQYDAVRRIWKQNKSYYLTATLLHLYNLLAISPTVSSKKKKKMAGIHATGGDPRNDAIFLAYT